MPRRDYGAELSEETHKWAARLATRRASTVAARDEGEGLLRNIDAYETDAKHFEAEGDLVRAFESVVWAWAWLEIGEDLGYLFRPPDSPQDEGP
ncbi:MAG: DUF357 domain-containing protein [Methanobacteriota archaeon]